MCKDTYLPGEDLGSVFLREMEMGGDSSVSAVYIPNIWSQWRNFPERRGIMKRYLAAERSNLHRAWSLNTEQSRFAAAVENSLSLRQYTLLLHDHLRLARAKTTHLLIPLSLPALRCVASQRSGGHAPKLSFKAQPWRQRLQGTRKIWHHSVVQRLWHGRRRFFMGRRGAQMWNYHPTREEISQFQRAALIRLSPPQP